MATYMKLEETIVDTDTPLKDDLMGLSLLSLLISPWAVLGLTMSLLNHGGISGQASLICTLVLLAAMPKIFQLLSPHCDSLPQKKVF